MKNTTVMIFKVIIILIIFLITAIIVFAVYKGKGKAIKLTDKNGSEYKNGISTREKVKIGGEEQYIFLTGENKDNPVLLFLHGGPGSPEVALNSFKEGERLEEKFTVCYWEQRGSGLSYNAKPENDEDMTLDLMVSDTLELSNYLRNRFNQDKIYIMGHSWGSFLGVKAIIEKPEYYKAYFGIGQVVNQVESEKLAYEYMVNKAKQIGDKKALKEFEKYNIENESFPENKYILTTRTKYMNKYGIGIMHEENYKMSKLIKEVLLFEGYSLSDFVKYGLGGLYSNKTLFKYVLEDNLMDNSYKFEIPVYILQGKYDYQVSHDLAKKYYEKIEKKKKGFYSFENSAHSPNFEETDKFLDIVFNILRKNENRR